MTELNKDSGKWKLTRVDQEWNKIKQRLLKNSLKPNKHNSMAAWNYFVTRHRAFCNPEEIMMLGTYKDENDNIVIYFLYTPIQEENL